MRRLVEPPTPKNTVLVRFTEFVSGTSSTSQSAPFVAGHDAHVVAHGHIKAAGEVT
jgi:hypothetical protein